MAASFPSSIKSFSQVVNGVTKLVALLFNSNYDETEALETFIGALGRSQSYSASIMNALKNYRRGVRLEYSDEDTLIVTAGEISIPNASTGRCFRVNTSDITDLEWTDLDTGSEANSTTYYVYVVADASGTTFTAVISASDSAPSGYTYYRKIGSFYNDSGGDIDSHSIYNEDDDDGKKYGAAVTLAQDTVYQAPCDGVVEMYVYGGEACGGTICRDQADGTTEIGRFNNYYAGSTARQWVSFTVKRGDYWKVDTSYNGSPFFRPKA